MKKLILYITLAITALSAAAFGGCSNGQTYGGEKAEKGVEQTAIEENDCGESCKQGHCENCNDENCDGSCKENCQDEDCKNNPEQQNRQDFKGKKYRPRTKMPRFSPDNPKQPKKPMPIAPSPEKG